MKLGLEDRARSLRRTSCATRSRTTGMPSGRVFVEPGPLGIWTRGVFPFTSPSAKLLRVCCYPSLSHLTVCSMVNSVLATAAHAPFQGSSTIFGFRFPGRCPGLICCGPFGANSVSLSGSQRHRLAAEGLSLFVWGSLLTHDLADFVVQFFGFGVTVRLFDFRYPRPQCFTSIT